MDKTIKILAEVSGKSLRLDKFLAEKIKTLTRSQIKKIINSKGVRVNKKIVISASEKVKDRSEIEVLIETKGNNDYIEPKKIGLNIIYDDREIIIVDKPSGLTVHPGAGNKSNTLVNGLMHIYKNSLSNLSGSFRPGIVHRIDKETSGLIVIARNNFTHAKLSEQFSDHTVKRKYIALVWGVIRPLKGKISTLISRSKKNRQLMSVSNIKGKTAITNYKTIKVFNVKNIPKISLIECILETGRTHQIRVHLSYKGNPLLGDKKYGKKKLKFRKIDQNFFKILTNFNRQALHAKTLGFVHPKTKKLVNFESKMPQDFQKMLNYLKNLAIEKS